MLGSTLALAMGLTFLAAARLSGNPTAYGLVVLLGILLVAVSCAMHVSVVLDRVLVSAALRRRIAKLAVWLIVAGGTAWLIGRTPSEEVLVALMVVPALIGVAGLAVGGNNRLPAVTYLAVAALLTALAVWVWLDA